MRLSSKLPRAKWIVALEMVNKIRFAFAGPPTLGTYEAFGMGAHRVQ